MLITQVCFCFESENFETRATKAIGYHAINMLCSNEAVKCDDPKDESEPLIPKVYL